ncbi:MAG: hypothetical protein CMH53_08275 [Myxococcales bacterium]|nr:hypothetical protein [Myxococcales bacterium]
MRPLSYTQTGPGPERSLGTLVLVHGFPDGPQMWQQTVAAMNALGYTTVNIALPGYGSKPTNDDLAQSFDELSDRLLMTIEHAGALGQTLIAHDWGAVLAYLMLQKRPDALARLVALDVGVAPRSIGRALLVITYQAWLVAAHWVGGPLGDWFTERLCSWILRRPRYEGAAAALARHAWLYRQAWREAHIGGKRAYYYRNRIAPWTPHSELAVLFAYGRDLWQGVQFHDQRWRGMLLNANSLNRVRPMAGGHWFFMENSDAFHAELQDFLEATCSSSERRLAQPIGDD